MTPNPSLWSFISQASFVVQLVMLILLFASIASWSIIIQRGLLLKQVRTALAQFKERFWSGVELNELWKYYQNKSLSGLAGIFTAGFDEYLRLSQKPHTSADAIMEGTQRAMYIAQNQQMDALERNLAFLATVGSVSPYIGLFGTVWGIMSAFRALGSASQASIAMVAPGISEALVATAIGLLAAIPAVIAYNRYSNQLARIRQEYELFSEQMSKILHREVY